MTAVDKLIASVRKHMDRNRERRGWRGLKNWEKEVSRLAEEAYTETTRDSTDPTIVPSEWAAILHRVLHDRLYSQASGRRLAGAYEVSHVLKDGDHCKSSGQLIFEYASPAAQALLSLIAGTTEQPTPYTVPERASRGEAGDSHLTVRVSTFYDAKAAGTRIVYLAKVI